MALTRYQKIGITGVCMFVFSILFQTVIFPIVLKSEVKKSIALKQGWQMRDVWSKFPFVIEFRFYLFNVTNPQEIEKGEKPIVQEVGPFVYDKWHEKTNQIDNDEDDSISYTLRTTYYFNAEKSNGFTGDEELIIPHLFVLGLVNGVLREKPTALPIIGKAIDSILRKPTSLFIKAKARDIMFDGIPFRCDVEDFAGNAVCSEVRANYEQFGLLKRDENTFAASLFGAFNATDSRARTRVLRGLKNIMDVGKVIEYNNKPNISTWNDDYCDTFNGSDGTVFHPYFDKNGADDLVAFNPGLCRSVSCYFDSHTKFAGLKLLRYTTDLGTDGVNNPKHKCYCEDPDKCPKPGGFDLYKCSKAPIIVTNPHFYLADPYYLSKVDGLSPDKEKHMLIVDLDAFTGSPVHAQTRVMFSMELMKLQKIKIMKNFPEAVLPIFWFDEIIILSPHLIKQIKEAHRSVTFAKIFKFLMMFGGLGLSGYAGYKHYKSTQEDTKPQAVKAKTAVNKPNSVEKQINISTLQPAPVPPNVD